MFYIRSGVGKGSCAVCDVVKTMVARGILYTVRIHKAVDTLASYYTFPITNPFEETRYPKKHMAGSSHHVPSGLYGFERRDITSTLL